MIFVTVGTHEQQFNRLIKKIDELKRDGFIQEDVFIQTGFSSYVPEYCRWSKLIPYNEMLRMIKEARIIITHGGPASFIMPLQEHKIPIVVPRTVLYDEHVNDHQVEFVRFVAQRMGNILPVYNVDDLYTTINGKPLPLALRSRRCGSKYSKNRKSNYILADIVA